jgi:branched-chain amino acid transport system substrate-binding protein
MKLSPASSLRTVASMSSSTTRVLAREIPVASCTLSEPELAAIGPEAVDGHITSSVYFSSLETPENDRFVQAYRARFPDGPVVSADAEATYLAVRLLAIAVAKAGSDEASAVKRAVALRPIMAPQGEVQIDPETMHASLTPRIARSNLDGRFTVLREAPRPVPADPYLIRNSSRFGAVAIRPVLRVAS